MSSDDQWLTSMFCGWTCTIGTPSPSNRLFTIVYANLGFFNLNNTDRFLYLTDHGEWFQWTADTSPAPAGSGLTNDTVYKVVDAIYLGSGSWACNLQDVATSTYVSPSTPISTVFNSQIGRVNSNPPQGSDPSYIGIWYCAAMGYTALGNLLGDSAVVAAWAPLLADVIPRWAATTGLPSGDTWDFSIFSNVVGPGAIPVFAYQPSAT
jgi:hypothetical protein